MSQYFLSYKQLNNKNDKVRVNRKFPYVNKSEAIKDYLYGTKDSRIPCFYCGKWLLRKNATLEHLHKKSDGGTYSLSNVVIACNKCNCKRGDITPGKYKKIISRKLPTGRIVPDHIINVVDRISISLKQKTKQIVVEKQSLSIDWSVDKDNADER